MNPFRLNNYLFLHPSLEGVVKGAWSVPVNLQWAAQRLIEKLRNLKQALNKKMKESLVVEKEPQRRGKEADVNS